MSLTAWRKWCWYTPTCHKKSPVGDIFCEYPFFALVCFIIVTLIPLISYWVVSSLVGSTLFHIDWSAAYLATNKPSWACSATALNILFVLFYLILGVTLFITLCTWIDARQCREHSRKKIAETANADMLGILAFGEGAALFWLLVFWFFALAWFVITFIVQAWSAARGVGAILFALGATVQVLLLGSSFIGSCLWFFEMILLFVWWTLVAEIAHVVLRTVC